MEPRGSRDALAARLYADSAKAARAPGLTAAHQHSTSPLRPKKGIVKDNNGNVSTAGPGGSTVGAQSTISQSKSLPILALAAQKKLSAAPSVPILPNRSAAERVRAPYRKHEMVTLGGFWSS